MSKYKMISPAVPNVPWQEGPETFTGAPIWRYSENPVIGRNPLKNVARIFNSAVMPYGDGFIGVFRGEQNNGIPYIYSCTGDFHAVGIFRVSGEMGRKPAQGAFCQGGQKRTHFPVIPEFQEGISACGDQA